MSGELKLPWRPFAVSWQQADVRNQAPEDTTNPRYERGNPKGIIRKVAYDERYVWD